MEPGESPARREGKTWSDREPSEFKGKAADEVNFRTGRASRIGASELGIEPWYPGRLGEPGRDPASFLDGLVSYRDVVSPPAEQFNINAVRGMAVALVFDATDRAALVEWAVQNELVGTPEPALRDRQFSTGQIELCRLTTRDGHKKNDGKEYKDYNSPRGASRCRERTSHATPEDGHQGRRDEDPKEGLSRSRLGRNIRQLSIESGWTRLDHREAI